MAFSSFTETRSTEFYCIFNSISLYISLQFYRMAIKELVVFQAASKYSAAYEVEWGSKV